MGCPKEFSLKGGMGAALLMNPDKAKEILSTLVQNLKIPVTCKIRVFQTVEDTLQLVEQLVSTGIAAIAIHGRTKQERPQHANRNYLIKAIAQTINIPVIANGGSKEIQQHSDIATFRQECGTSSVMIARTAEDYDNSPNNTKYCIQNMLKELQETPRGKKFLECQTLEQICEIWNLRQYCKEKHLEYNGKGILSRRQVSPNMFCPASKKLKMEDTIEMPYAFIRASFPADPDLPKSKLISWCNKNKKEKPKYQIINEDKLFRAIVYIDGKKYSSTYWEKNKKFAEQGAALVCIWSLGLIDTQTLIDTGSTLK
ncbi:hypothetical protein AMK59_4858 [Oryctes borbonicus]|uniref:DRBM domain-containing protein n=1 Tax=Oryctes borbonicus TaxID=1629725 RepID=A0A0T6B8F6_9SCAR|nr:hypothetical protein AMK59_4858 [Oryctes borbonicus]